MTVDVSRNATVGEPWRSDFPARASEQAQVRVADPPLLTHVWRRLFERQARKSNRR
jgi:hypothetical protein